MPLYEYQCESCGKRLEKIQKFTDPPPATCPSCGSTMRKLPSSPAIQFKGSGWYITDYAKKPSTGTAKSGGTNGKSDTGVAPESKSDTGSGDASTSNKSEKPNKSEDKKG